MTKVTAILSLFVCSLLISSYDGQLVTGFTMWVTHGADANCSVNNAPRLTINSCPNPGTPSCEQFGPDYALLDPSFCNGTTEVPTALENYQGVTVTVEGSQGGVREGRYEVANAAADGQNVTLVGIPIGAMFPGSIFVAMTCNTETSTLTGTYCATEGCASFSVPNGQKFQMVKPEFAGAGTWFATQTSCGTPAPLAVPQATPAASPSGSQPSAAPVAGPVKSNTPSTAPTRKSSVAAIGINAAVLLAAAAISL